VDNSREIMIQTVQPIPKGKEFFKHKKNYKGAPHKQSDTVFEVFDAFFVEQLFDTIIELGSGAGGFSLYLAEKFGAKFHTFDIINKMDRYSDVRKRIESFESHVYFEDIFRSSNLKKLFAANKRILLLCDNGDKLRELQAFAPLLKNNDVIMVHDYFPTALDYENQNIWRCCAFTDADENYPDLYPYYKNELAKAFWMCRIKK